MPILCCGEPLPFEMSWPKSSSSMIGAGSAAQLIATNGAVEFGPALWMQRARSSLPVPASPDSRAARMGLAAMRVAMEIACWTAGLSPWNDSKPGCPGTVSFVAADLCDCKGTEPPEGRTEFGPVLLTGKSPADGEGDQYWTCVRP